MIVCEKCVTGGFVIASMLSSFYGWELFNFHQQFRVFRNEKTDYANLFAIGWIFILEYPERPQEKGELTHV